VKGKDEALLPQQRLLPSIDQLQRLGKELYLSDAAIALFYVVFAECGVEFFFLIVFIKKR
jgi:hypothetical protein